jgi:hypothetical protein
MIYSLAFFNKDLSIKQNGESRETAEWRNKKHA